MGSSGRRYTAAAHLPETPLCPECGDALVVRTHRARVPHFAHYPHRRCAAALTRAGRRRARTEARRRDRAVRAAEAAERSGQPGLFDLDPEPVPGPPPATGGCGGAATAG